MKSRVRSYYILACQLSNSVDRAMNPGGNEVGVIHYCGQLHVFSLPALYACLYK